MRKFIKIDNERALEVGYLNRSTGIYKVRKPKVPEGCLEVTVRENSDELTLRAEEVCTLEAYVNVDHIEKERWGPALVYYDWYASCQALFQGSSLSQVLGYYFDCIVVGLMDLFALRLRDIQRFSLYSGYM